MKEAQERNIKNIFNSVLKYKPHYLTATAGSAYVAYMETSALAAAVASTSTVTFLAAAPIACGAGLIAGAGTGLYFAGKGKNTGINSTNIKDLEEVLFANQAEKNNIEQEKANIGNESKAIFIQRQHESAKIALLKEKEENNVNEKTFKLLKQEKVKAKLNKSKMSPN